jgi:hypothetical protein
MNEQIEKLIDGLEPDAFMTYKGYLYHANDPKVLEHSDPEPLYTRQELEKFAELIIRECADLNFRSTGLVTTDGEIAIGNMIRNHFGVTE